MLHDERRHQDELVFVQIGFPALGYQFVVQQFLDLCSHGSKGEVLSIDSIELQDPIHVVDGRSLWEESEHDA